MAELSKYDREFRNASIIYWTLVILTLVVAMFLFNRNSQVFDFRMQTFDQVWYMIKDDNRKGIDGEWRHKKLVWMSTYQEMMWKFWIPLKTENWFNPDPTK